MVDFKVDEESRKALEERLWSPEGREIMLRLVRVIVESAVKYMPPELLQSLDTKEGRTALRAAWPEIVDAFLFRQPRPRKLTKKVVGTASDCPRKAARRRLEKK